MHIGCNLGVSCVGSETTVVIYAINQVTWRPGVACRSTEVNASVKCTHHPFHTQYTLHYDVITSYVKTPLLSSFIFTVRWICLPVSETLVARHHAWSSWSKTNYAASKSNVNVTGVHFSPFQTVLGSSKCDYQRGIQLFSSRNTETLLEASQMRGRVALRGP